MLVKKEDIFHVMGASKTGKSVNLMKGSIKTNILGSPDLSGETIGGGGIKLVKKQSPIVGALQSELKATEELLKNNIEKTKKSIAETMLERTPILQIPELTHAHFSRVGTIREKIKKRVVTIEDVLATEMLGRTLKKERIKKITKHSEKEKVVKPSYTGSSYIEWLKKLQQETPIKRIMKMHKEVIKSRSRLMGRVIRPSPQIAKPTKKVVRIPKKLRREVAEESVKRRKKRHLLPSEKYSEKLHMLLSPEKLIFGNQKPKLWFELPQVLKPKKK